MISQINFQSSPAQSHYIVKQSKHKYDTEGGYSMYKKVGNKTKIRYKANEMEGWDDDHHDADRYPEVYDDLENNIVFCLPPNYIMAVLTCAP